MKTYTEDEINTLIDELQKELPEILKAEAASNAEGLAKAEGSVYPTAKEGGNGTTPEVKGNNNMSKGAQSFAKADGDSEPKAEPADDEGGSDSAPSPSGPPADASSPPAGASPSPDASAAPAPDASASPAGAVDPAAAAGPQDPAMGGDQGGQLEQAYAALSDDELRAHMQALTATAMTRMGAQQDPMAGGMGAGSPPPAADPMGAAGAPPAGPDMPAMAPPAGPDASASMSPPPPAQKAMPAPMAPPMMKAAPSPGMIVKSAQEQETLRKAEDRIQGLEKTLEGVTSLLEAILTKPVQKSVTSMAEYIAKSESDKPAARRLSRTELMKAATEKSKQPDLTKSDRDVINRFVLSGEGLAELEKLLKE